MKVIRVKVLTFNIHHGKGFDHTVNLKRISEIIHSSNADMIGLNEVDNQFSKRSNYVNQALWLAKSLNMNYVFGPAITMKDKGHNRFRQYGNALLSRFPILKSKNYPFNFMTRFIEDRALLEADIQIQNKIITVFVTHLSLAPFLHRKQTSFIIKKVKETTPLSIVMGDWNMKPFSKSWRKVTASLKDTSCKNEHLFTYPSKKPRVKLDYIFVKKEMNVVSAEVYKSHELASDHLPLTATIEVN